MPYRSVDNTFHRRKDNSTGVEDRHAISLFDKVEKRKMNGRTRTAALMYELRYFQRDLTWLKLAIFSLT
jgi:hypothetical protein